MTLPDKLTPNDPRVQHKFFSNTTRTYHYLDAGPPSPRATIFLIHGWPDLSFGWRYQIPVLLSLGFRIIAPDMQGYGLSSAPDELAAYSIKTACDDMAALAASMDLHKIYVMGHDWGGAVVWRFAAWYPRLVKAVVSVCTPYWAPSTTYTPLEEQVATVLPNFAYQVQLAGPDVEREIVGATKIKQFLSSLYGGRGPQREVGFSTAKGAHFENLDKIQRPAVVDEMELDFYVGQYMRNGIRGPLNWYRTRKLNFDEEKPLAEEGAKIRQPCLFIMARRDAALPPRMSQGMERTILNLKRGEVDAEHWALWEAPGECNAMIRDFLVPLLRADHSKL